VFWPWLSLFYHFEDLCLLFVESFHALWIDIYDGLLPWPYVHYFCCLDSYYQWIAITKMLLWYFEMNFLSICTVTIGNMSYLRPVPILYYSFYLCTCSVSGFTTLDFYSPESEVGFITWSDGSNLKLSLRS